jgi:hypothetical protein
MDPRAMKAARVKFAKRILDQMNTPNSYTLNFQKDKTKPDGARDVPDKIRGASWASDTSESDDEEEDDDDEKDLKSIKVSVPSPSAITAPSAPQVRRAILRAKGTKSSSSNSTTNSRSSSKSSSRSSSRSTSPLKDPTEEGEWQVQSKSRKTKRR